MINTDPLAFLDEEQSQETRLDPLSFLDEGQRANETSKDPLAFLDEEAKSQDQGFWARALKSFGEANLLQMQSGGPAGAPALSPEQAKKVGTEVGTIAAVEGAFAPLVGIAEASAIAPRVLSAFTRLTQAGATGAGVATTSKLVEKGELPSKEELLKDGLTWVAIDALMQGLHLSATGGKKIYDFGQAVRKIAKEDNVPVSKVLNQLWGATKNYVKSKFGRNISAPQDIKPQDVEILIDEAKRAEKNGLAKETEIDITPGKGKEIELKQEPKKETTLYHGTREDFKDYDFDRSGGMVFFAQDEDVAQRYALGQSGGRAKLTPSNSFFEDVDGNLFLWSEKTNNWRPYGRFDEEKYPSEENVVKFTDEEAKKIPPVSSEKANKSVLENWEGSFIPKKSHIKTENFNDLKIADLKTEEGRQLIAGLSPQTRTGRLIVDAARKGGKNGLPDLNNTFWQWTKDARSKEIGNDLKTDIVNPLKKMGYDGIAFRDDQHPSIALFDNAFKKKTAKASAPKKTAEEKPLKAKIKQSHPKTGPRQPIRGQKQAVARSKILKLFRTAFTDPIRLGKFKQKAAGIHKLWPKVTRLLNDNDVETAAHEIGHNLHTTLYGGHAKTPSEQARNINAALRPYLGELKPLAHYEPWGMEGFAEFVRLYVTNPDVALELAPKFYAKFEADLEAQYPEMKNALLEARDYYETYLQGTPQSRIRAQTSYGEDKGKLANIIDAAKRYLDPDFLKTEFLDDVFPAKRLVAEAFGIPLTEVESLKDERNLYRALRVLKGAVGKGDVFVLHETFNPKTLKKINGSLKDILKQLPDEESYREFNDYLIARRSIEKLSQDVKTGINLGDAIAVEADLRPKYGKLAKELDKYNDTLLMYARDAGLLSPEQYSMIKKNNLMYVPFQREMGKEKGGTATGSGELQAGKAIKRMKGSSRDIIAPIESVLKNTYSIIINAEKNLAGQVLAKIAKMKNVGAYVESVPTPIKLKGKIEGEQVARDLAKRFEKEGLGDLIEYDDDGKPILREDIADAIPEVFLRFGAGQYPAGENIVTVYFDGKPKYYEVSKEIFDMWDKGISPYMAGLLTKILRVPASILRAGAILNPKFMLKNAVRDTWGGWLFTRYGKSIKDPEGLFMDTIYSPLAMLATAATKSSLYTEWLKAGGGMSTMQSLDRQAVNKKLEEVRHGYKPHQIIKWLRTVAEISEEANRLSEFGRALEVEGTTRLGMEIAAFAARDLSVDFAKIGLQTKMLNQIIPFFNATVQGGDKLIRSMADPKHRKEFLPRAIGFILLPSLILAWLNQDDDNIKEFYGEERDFNFITKINGQYLKIPVPFETGVLVHGLTQRMYDFFIKKDPEAFEQFMGSILSATLPGAIPTFAHPAIETAANKNFFTGARIIPASQERLISRYQYKNNTSLTARLIGRLMTYMLGQETRSKAASPAIIDHFIRSWTGGLGNLAVNILDAAFEAAGLGDKIPGPDRTIVEKLGLDAFSLRYPRANTRSIEKFYDNYQDATARRTSFKHAEKVGLESKEDIDIAKKRFHNIYDYKTLQEAYKAMQKSQKAINSIWNDPALQPELKKMLIDDLYLQQIEFAKAANEDIRKYRLAKEE